MGIELKDLSFSYGAHAVLKGVDFTASDGQLVAVLGQNGAGKSTLFKCILGFLKDYTGCITCDGVDLRGISARELAKRIAYIPQSSTPVFNYTVADAVLMGTANQLSALQMPGQEQKDRVVAVLEELGIAHLRHKGYGRISGGERQLTLVARALVQRAKVLVMDEPTANLDYGNQFRVLEKIKALTGQGYTVLMSTHNPEQAFRFADRILLLHDGAVLASGAPEAVLTGENLARVFGVEVALLRQEINGRPVCVCVPVALTDRK